MQESAHVDTTTGIMNAIPHHLGCAVNSLEDGCATYGGALGFRRRSRQFEIKSQQVSVCFIELRDSFYLELIKPLNDNAKLARFLGVGFYHLCFLVEDLGAAQERLRDEHFFALPAFESEGFDGCLCQFFLNPQMHLIELAQMSMHDFRVFFSANIDADS